MIGEQQPAQRTRESMIRQDYEEIQEGVASCVERPSWGALNMQISEGVLEQIL